MIRHQHCERIAAKSILLKTQEGLEPIAICKIAVLSTSSVLTTPTRDRNDNRGWSARRDIRLLGSIYPRDHCAVPTMVPKRG